MKKDLVLVLALTGFFMAGVAAYVAFEARKQVLSYKDDLDGFQEVIEGDNEIIATLGERLHGLAQRVEASQDSTLTQEVEALRRDVKAANERADNMQQEGANLRVKLQGLIERVMRLEAAAAEAPPRKKTPPKTPPPGERSQPDPLGPEQGKKSEDNR